MYFYFKIKFIIQIKIEYLIKERYNIGVNKFLIIGFFKIMSYANNLSNSNIPNGSFSGSIGQPNIQQEQKFIELLEKVRRTQQVIEKTTETIKKTRVAIQLAQENLKRKREDNSVNLASEEEVPLSKKSKSSGQEGPCEKWNPNEIEDWLFDDIQGMLNMQSSKE